MSASPSQIELLAPAKTAEIGKAAISHGADAVYIGGPSFGARANAGNTLPAIEELIDYAHQYDARIFIALNTILDDRELEEAEGLIHRLYAMGADALIIQDMGLLMLDLPPIQLHASTQCDIRTPEKARFLESVGFSQLVLARELTLPQIEAVAQRLDGAILEFFIHGALCVAYSGQCYVSHAQTGRSANRGDCSQACRLPYEVLDSKGRILAHQKHVLSVKDNDQSANLKALIDAGIRSFKIEGRYKDLAYVKNITSHYRILIDSILEARDDLGRASSGITRFFFDPEPERTFNRGQTDYFVNGRKADIGAFDTPTPTGLPLGTLVRVANDHFEVSLESPDAVISNGDTLTYFDLQKHLQGFRVNVAERCQDQIWRAYPNQPVNEFKHFTPGLEIFRSRDMAWERLMESDRTSSRKIPVEIQITEHSQGLEVRLRDDEGHEGRAKMAQPFQLAKNAEASAVVLQQTLSQLGNTLFEARNVHLERNHPDGAGFWPPGLQKRLRREAVEQLLAARRKGFARLTRRPAAEPPAQYPEDSLSYLANVYNSRAQQFYMNHGVKVVEPAYEAHQEMGDVSLMITRHCVRFSLSLCPKQTKGITGVQGTIKAEPLELVNGKERLRLEFDCKACEMHVMGKIRPQILKQHPAHPLHFQKSGPRR